MREPMASPNSDVAIATRSPGPIQDTRPIRSNAMAGLLAHGVVQALQPSRKTSGVSKET